MPLNPYDVHLAGQDPRAVLASTPGLLHQACCALAPEQLAAPIAPGKWSPCQIAAHMADCELVFSVRLRQTLEPAAGEPGPVVQPFDQDRWALHYAAYDVPAALELFRASRVWNLKLIGTLGQADLARAITHPERGSMTFQTVLETMAGHDLNHLLPLQRLAQANPTPAATR